MTPLRVPHGFTMTAPKFKPPSPPRIFSGMQPTGELHIGNYFGALRNWVDLSKDGQHAPVFCIVDAHAITIDYDIREMPARIFDAALTYLAAGLDPERVTLFVQSDVAEHMELAWYLASVTAMGDLYRMTQFKEKSDQHKQNVNAGLFTYPILMAADILLYRASVVPVGNDQVQHLELAREICRKFNARYGDVFIEPQPRLSTTPRIMGLDGKAKMSKSRGNAVGLFEPPKQIEKKLKGAFTDPEKLRQGDPGRPEICNIYTMHNAVTPQDAVGEIGVRCRSGELGCGDCKKALVQNLMTELGPVRENAERLRGEPKKVLDVLQAGAARARGIASETMKDVRSAMGVGAKLPKR